MLRMDKSKLLRVFRILSYSCHTNTIYKTTLHFNFISTYIDDVNDINVKTYWSQ